MDLRPQDRAALDLAFHAVDLVRPEHLGQPTPCAGWTVADLLRHMIAQNERFAAAARGEDADAASPIEGRPLGATPSAEFARSAERVTAAFAAADIAERQLALPELPDGLPTPVAIGFHFTDFLVHGWDVARSIAAPFEPPPALTSAAVELASRIPEEARGAGRPFGAIRTTPPDATDFARLLALTGRDATWNPDQDG